MGQFDLYENPSKTSRKRVPYLLDVQADLLDGLETRVVIPLANPELLDGRVIQGLTPPVEVDGVSLLLLTPEIAGVHKSMLGARIGSLLADRTRIIAALDLLITGV